MNRDTRLRPEHQFRGDRKTAGEDLACPDWRLVDIRLSRHLEQTNIGGPPRQVADQAIVGTDPLHGGPPLLGEAADGKPVARSLKPGLLREEVQPIAGTFAVWGHGSLGEW